MMRDYDIKFVGKEITPFGGLSLFLKMLERCSFDKQLENCNLPMQGSNRGYKPLQLILGLFAGVWCGACCFGHLDVVRYDKVCYAVCLAVNAEQTIGRTSAISTSSHRRSISGCSAICTVGSSHSWYSTTTRSTSTLR